MLSKYILLNVSIFTYFDFHIDLNQNTDII